MRTEPLNVFPHSGMNRPVLNGLVMNRPQDEPTVLNRPVMNRPVMNRPGIILLVLSGVLNANQLASPRRNASSIILLHPLGGIAIHHVCLFVRLCVREHCDKAEYLENGWRQLLGYNGAPIGNRTWRIK